jgi:hypothetical protein
MRVKRYDKGGDVGQLLKALESQSSRSPMGKLPVSSGLSGLQANMPVMNQLSAASSTSTPPEINPYFKESIESAAFDRMIMEKNEELKQIKKLGFDPMASGSAESVSPMKFVSPVGDVEDMYEGVKMAYEGVKEGKAGKAALGSGLALGAAALAFVPGNAGMIRSYAQSVNNPMLDRIVKGLSEEGANAEEVIRNVSRDFTQAERQATRDDARQLVDMSFDEFSGLDLSNSERLLLEEIGEVSSTGSSSGVIKKAESRVTPEIPERVGDFEFEVNPDGASMNVLAESGLNTDYMELDITPLKGAQGVPENIQKKYGDRYVAKIDVDMSSTMKKASEESKIYERAKAKRDKNLNLTSEEQVVLETFKPLKAQKDQYKIMNSMFDQVQSGDLVNPGQSGGLSTDSYPMFINQLRKGKKHLDNPGKIKKQGTKLLNEEGAIQFGTLNTMGEFSNGFRIPDREWKQVVGPREILKDGRVEKTPGMLTGEGTSDWRGLGFESQSEANEYLEIIKEKYIDPYLEAQGLPSSKMIGTQSEGGRRLEFPYPVVEKLLNGGRIRSVKKRKKGMQVKKR